MGAHTAMRTSHTRFWEDTDTQLRKPRQESTGEIVLGFLIGMSRWIVVMFAVCASSMVMFYARVFPMPWFLTVAVCMATFVAFSSALGMRLQNALYGTGEEEMDEDFFSSKPEAGVRVPQVS
jgi:hypothetical protein